MGKNLIVFIDSFPYLSLDDTRFLSSFRNKAKVTPGLGYSINVKAEMFAGLCPDEVGFFCEWMYAPDSPLRRYQPLFSCFWWLSRLNYYGDRALHKLLSKILGQNIFNIPFNKLGYFKKSGVSAYEDEFPFPTIFSQMRNLRKVLYSRYSPIGRRDGLVFAEAKEVIEANKYDNFFVALADLDHLTHRVGVGSQKHIEKIIALDKELETLCDLFIGKNPRGNIFILSDHGMANVRRTVEINLEEQFGKPGEDSYIYFIDSTMLRIWIFRHTLKLEIEEYLSTLNYGHILSSEERERFGVKSEKFGQIIFLLDEGIVFIPSFFGRRVPKAMHGYHPDLETQKGIFLSSKHLNTKIVTARDIFLQLSDWLNLNVPESRGE